MLIGIEFKNKRKKAISTIIGYVLLISIGLFLAVGVAVWFRYIADVSPPANCEVGTSVIVESFNCLPIGMDLKLKNNGRFNVDGIILTIGQDADLPSVTSLIPAYIVNEGLQSGYYFFNDSLKPGGSEIAYFSNEVYEFGTNQRQTVGFQDVGVIQVQPFIVHETGVIICTDSLIKEEISDCKIK
jgi:hypothetical protein